MLTSMWGVSQAGRDRNGGCSRWICDVADRGGPFFSADRGGPSKG